MKECDYCGKPAEIDLAMPLPIGMFKGDFCIDCGLKINTESEMLVAVIKKRAEKMGIALPAKAYDLQRILNNG